MFIVFEGIDGCGKGTQAALAQKYLIDSFGSCALFHYPDRSTPIGVLIDQWLHGGLYLNRHQSPASVVEQATALQAFFIANRAEVHPSLMRALRKGHVVSDRYVSSGIAYGQADGLDADWLISSHAVFRQPDMTILLDISPDVSFVRRPDDREAYENNVGRLSYARDVYLKMAKSNSKKWLVIDGTQSPSAVSLQVNDFLNWYYQQDV